jgi:hypothetical protein
MASGSQAWKGNCADLVKAARAISTATNAANPGDVDHTSSTRMSLRRVVPVATHIATTAASRHSPPAMVTRKVRIAGSLACGPERAMSRKEHSVVNSHITNSRTTSSARTSPSIAAAKNVMRV